MEKKRIFDIFSKKKLQGIIGRLGIALVALSLVAVLILWDTGIIDLPFLERSERREPVTETEEEPLTEEILATDYPAFAEKLLSFLYNANAVTDYEKLVTRDLFDRSTTSLVKSRLVGNQFRNAYGFLIREDLNSEAVFRLPSMKQLTDTEKYVFTGLQDQSGRALFQNASDKGYYIWDQALNSYVASEYDPKLDGNGSSLVLPTSYGKGDENKTLVYKDGLYGYSGSYKDGRKTREFTVDAVYPTAYRYSEGFAVMADADGKVVIRNEKGEVVFDGLKLLMTEKTDEEALGFHYFDHGLLRVVIASYDENGTLKSKRESVINRYGEEVLLPQGYHAVSYLEGIFVVTNGDQYGYVSADGAWIGSPVYSDAAPFHEGLAVVTNKDGKMGLLDRNGDLVLEMAFDRITDFSEGTALLYTKEEGWYLLSKVKGIYPPSTTPPPTSSQFQTKVTITRGPQNTFDHEPDIIITLPPILSTPSRTTHPEFSTTKPKQ